MSSVSTPPTLSRENLPLCEHLESIQQEEPIVKTITGENNCTEGMDTTQIKEITTSGTMSEGEVAPTEQGKTLSRTQTTLLLITNAVGMGVLSLPYALLTLGLIPGIIAIIGVGLLTGYTAYVLLQFQRKYPSVMNIADIGKVIGGKPLEIFVGVGFVLNLCLCAASTLVTLSVGLNFISNHGMCTVGFIGFWALLIWLLCLPRTMKFAACLGWPSTVSIIVSVLIVMIYIGIHGPQNAPIEFKKEIVLVGEPSFIEGTIAVLGICFAFAGTQSFPTVMSEMVSPSNDFLPALVYLQLFATTIYITVAVTIYSYAAQLTRSVALASAPKHIAKIAYGVVFPCIIGSGLVFGNSAIKCIYVGVLRMLKAPQEEIQNHNFRTATRRSWIIWLIGGIVFWTCTFVLANAIPLFQSILAIAASIFIAWFTFGLPAMAWFYLNRKTMFSNWKKLALCLLNAVILIITLFMNTGGMYVAIVDLLNVFKDPAKPINAPFTCADTSSL